MQRHEITLKTKRQKKQRVGRGDKTAGRGTKGQNARAGARVRPEIRDFIKSLPKLRGRGVNINKSIQQKPSPVSLTTISTHFKDSEVVSPGSLFKKGLITKTSGKLPVVKILSTGELDKKVIIVSCLVSKTAQEKVTKAGGTIK